MKVFGRFRNEIWCMDLAYDDKLAKDNNSVEFLLFRQDVFYRNVDAKGKKTKGSEEEVSEFLTMITKKESTYEKLGQQVSRICLRV